MSKYMVLTFFVLIAGLAVAQTAQQNGSPEAPAASAMPGPGMYSMPFIPLFSTPIQQLPTPALKAGASDATGQNVAGAGNGTAAVTTREANVPLVEPRISGDAKVASDIYPHSNDLGDAH